jgi:DNA-binding Xre family transcriptional regulator
MEAHKSQGAKLESHDQGEGREERAPEAGPHEGDGKKEGKGAGGVSRAKKVKNNVRKLRMERMMSKAELARRSGLSTLTVDRVERGMSCRMDTKRKILEALELKPQDRVKVFGDSDED